MAKVKVSLHLRLDTEVMERLRAFDPSPGFNRSEFVEKAILYRLDYRGASELDAYFGQRLHRLSNQMHRIERDSRIQLESLALFIHHAFLRDAHLPDPDASAQAVAKARFETFVRQVSARLVRGDKSLNPDTSQEGV